MNIAGSRETGTIVWYILWCGRFRGRGRGRALWSSTPFNRHVKNMHGGETTHYINTYSGALRGGGRKQQSHFFYLEAISGCDWQFDAGRLFPESAWHFPFRNNQYWKKTGVRRDGYENTNNNKKRETYLHA